MCNERVPAVEVEHTYICVKYRKRYREADKALACFNSHKKAIEVLDQSYFFGESAPNMITVKLDDDTTDVYYRLR